MLPAAATELARAALPPRALGAATGAGRTDTAGGGGARAVAAPHGLGAPQPVNVRPSGLVASQEPRLQPSMSHDQLLYSHNQGLFPPRALEAWTHAVCSAGHAPAVAVHAWLRDTPRVFGDCHTVVTAIMQRLGFDAGVLVSDEGGGCQLRRYHVFKGESTVAWRNACRVQRTQSITRVQRVPSHRWRPGAGR